MKWSMYIFRRFRYMFEDKKDSHVGLIDHVFVSQSGKFQFFPLHGSNIWDLWKKRKKWKFSITLLYFTKWFSVSKHNSISSSSMMINGCHETLNSIKIGKYVVFSPNFSEKRPKLLMTFSNSFLDFQSRVIFNFMEI